MAGRLDALFHSAVRHLPISVPTNALRLIPLSIIFSHRGLRVPHTWHELHIWTIHTLNSTLSRIDVIFLGRGGRVGVKAGVEWSLLTGHQAQWAEWVCHDLTRSCKTVCSEGWHPQLSSACLGSQSSGSSDVTPRQEVGRIFSGKPEQPEERPEYSAHAPKWTYRSHQSKAHRWHVVPTEQGLLITHIFLKPWFTVEVTIHTVEYIKHMNRWDDYHKTNTSPKYPAPSRSLLISS